MRGRLIKISCCIALACGIMVACKDRQDTVGWEPELAMPLALFSLDINSKMDVGGLAQFYFDQIYSQADKNTLLYNALNQGLEDSVKRRLPQYLQYEVELFMAGMKHAGSTDTEKNPTSFVGDLFYNLSQNGSVTATDLIAYYLLDGLPTTRPNLRQQALDSLYHCAITVGESVGIDIKEINERADRVLWMQVQMSANTRLAANARMQVYLYDANGVLFDSLLWNSGGANEGKELFTEGKEKAIRYYDKDKAVQIANVETVRVQITSDSLCIDFEQIKDLYQRKVNAAVGMMIKVNMDDSF